MAGMNLEPFPRQVLMGQAAAGATWYSKTYDLSGWTDLTWWFEPMATLPAGQSNPATLFVESSNDLNGPWEQLIPGGSDPNIGNVTTGTVTLTARWVRFRVDIVLQEATLLAVRAVARRNQ